jgi:hypothetical protein
VGCRALACGGQIRQLKMYLVKALGLAGQLEADDVEILCRGGVVQGAAHNMFFLYR